MNRIIYVPGKNPKPPAAEHEALLFRCLVHGVSRMRGETAEAIAASGCFSLVAWNRLFYHEEKAIGDFTPWVEQMLSREAPPDEREVRRHQRKYRLSRFLYQAGDSLPFLIPLIPDRRIKASIADTERYFANHGNIACKVRDVLKERLRESAKAGDRLLLIAHSMGSIIAWDSLYELHRLEGIDHCVDHWLTIGSPLGMNYVQRRLLGMGNTHPEHFPGNIRQWSNISARGDLVALDPELANDYRDMVEGGYVERIDDYRKGVFNHYRDEKGLNVHKSYGYLVNPAFSRIVTDWWEAA